MSCDWGCDHSRAPGLAGFLAMSFIRQFSNSFWHPPVEQLYQWSTNALRIN
jgi:hypothetical protein